MAGDTNGVFVFFNFGTECAHAIKRAVAIDGGGKMPQFAGAFGDGGQHGIAMGDGFVARRLDAAGDAFRGLDGLLFHAAILACACAYSAPQRASGRGLDSDFQHAPRGI